ncbi:unnamed protein product [Caenorhabditis angaria]|uniref:DUF38 domain-containing protein n=1 Tax=Caenorhabditis angaria TaxID=860376 RepID=A0A9P1IM68_9PELO|nr:unnamed protein product [Caenorhabditis angaria]
MKTKIFLLIFIKFFPIFETLDFDEITYRKIPAMDFSTKLLKSIQEQQRKVDVKFVSCVGKWDDETLFDVQHKFKNFENSTIDVAAIRYVGDQTVLYFEVFSESSIHYRLAFYWVLRKKDGVPSYWGISHVMDISCKKWKNQVMGWNYDLKLTIVSVIELYNFFEERQNATNGREVLAKRFADNFEMKFCDGAKFKYFFKDSDGIVNSEELQYHDSVDFHRNNEEDKLEGISQCYMTINGRKLQIEHNDDKNQFTKGREYPCD